MEITLGFGSYCKVSSYQEGLESAIDHRDLCDVIASSYYGCYITMSDEIDY